MAPPSLARNAVLLFAALSIAAPSLAFEPARFDPLRADLPFSLSLDDIEPPIHSSAELQILPPLVLTADATTILWSSAVGSAWLTGGNWTGGAVPGGTQTAEFGVNPTSGTTGVGINMNTPGFVQQVGAIYVDSNRLAPLVIGNSSTTAGATGTLQLNGVIVNGVDNVILRNNSSQLLTLQNTQGSGTRTMDVALGNATDNVINIDGTGGITISSVIKNGAGNHITLGGSGSGVLLLSGANTYTGGTTINSGTLRAGSTSALGSGSLTFSNGSSGKFQLNGFNISVTDLVFNQSNSGSPMVENANATSATLTVSPSGTDAFAGVLRNGTGDGTLGLTMNGTGQLILYNMNTYTGATTINSGTLTFNSNTSPNISGSANNSTIHLGATTGSATATLGLGFNPPNTISSPLIVEGGGTGTRLLTSFANAGTNTFSGPITMNSDLTVQSGSNNGPSAFGTFLLNGTSINLNNHVLTVNDTPLDTGIPGNLNLQGKVIISAPISGTGGSIVKNGSGTLILQGANNSYTGGTQIGGGVLGVDRDLSLGAVPVNETNNIFFTGDGTLQDASNDVTLAQNRDINIASGKTATFDSNGHTFTIDGSINGSGNIAKTGSGILTLTGPNFVTGTVTINTNGGILNAAANSALGSGFAGTAIGPSSITVNSGGTLMLSNSSATDRVRSDASITLGGGTIGRSGPGVVSEGSGATKTNGILNPGVSTAGLGALTLTSNSTIDFNLLGNGGVGTLTFASFSTITSTLNITNWISSASFLTQTSGVDGTDDRLVFGGVVAPNTAFITFDGTPSGLIPLDAGFWEVVPVPEPGTWMGAALALTALGLTRRRKLQQFVRRRT